ncbi:MAG: class I SAM-dependent methyltransferase [Pseudomonadota bacterium]
MPRFDPYVKPAMPPVAFVCPSCRQDLEHEKAAYICATCDRRYPILFGIADFRQRGDRYLSLEAERDKARKLYEYGRGATFADLVTYYYAITDDVSPALARRYQAYIHAAPERGRRILDALGVGDEIEDKARPRVLVDVGCGSGGLLLAAASRFEAVVGIDVALRWLVICAKRFEEAGLGATLVCAEVGAMPFKQGAFSHALAADLMEHVDAPAMALRAIADGLAPQGRLYLSAANKYSLGPHPSVRLWAIGFLPPPLRRRLVRLLRGVDSLRHVTLLSPWRLARLCRASGLAVVRLAALPVDPQARRGYPPVDRVLMGVYAALLAIWGVRHLLLLVGPAFEMVCRKKAA